ncbi:MAG: bifunctional D-glycero-beta-D-manno-heptose-7-phosphate kinase/D-glycero-beta-D-manno-heptose 1-phosphate adenylyltransferase HldE [Pseudomonadales bacterium]|nr:bifunctional D-glycero-beta-D-manno-heptose-7-phosphate kinase/D-glycero-beta-D-manno-heptose 1-phosphate adenylyltransferase HldE [Pseudomonadales bacterium]
MTRQLPSAPGVHVLVVGDVMLDRYLHGRAEHISQEAPVPVVQVDGSEDRLGGAANVALNVVSLGARCTLVGAIGDDPNGRTIAGLLETAGIQTDLVVAEDWRTTLKERVVSRQNQIARMDFEAPMPSWIAVEVAKRAERRRRGADAVVIEDYDKGAVNDPQLVIRAVTGVPVIVDPKFKPFAEYRGATILKPNRREFQRAIGRWPEEAELRQAGSALAKSSGVEAIALTRGGEGLTLLEASGDCRHLAALGIDVYDSTGAGDTVAATLGVCTARRWSRSESAHVANVAGGLVCAKSGTAAVSLPELNLALRSDSRVVPVPSSRRRLAASVSRAQSNGEKVVFTNGCFDILHAGHVGYLKAARQLGDRLIVAVNDDDSVRRLKGRGRPVNNLEQRMRVVEELSSVDWVVSFSEETPETLLTEIRPDVLVKGGDYALHEVVGADLVREYGGEVHVLGLVEDCSTSELVERIRSA